MYGDAWSELKGYGADDVVVKGMQMGETLARKVAALLAPAV
jgi:esterase/lipase